jgi:hypothetical protein
MEWLRDSQEFNTPISNTPILQYSNTPILQYSDTPATPELLNF